MAFLSHPSGLRGNVRWSSSPNWKALIRLPISVNWTFLLGIMAEGLRVNIDWKLVISLERGQFDKEFQVEGVAPPPTILLVTKLG